MDIWQLVLLSRPRVLIGRYHTSNQCVLDLHGRNRCMDRTRVNLCQNVGIPVVFGWATHVQIYSKSGLIPSIQSDDQKCTQCANSTKQRDYQGHFTAPASMVSFLKNGLLCESFNSIGKLTALFLLYLRAALPCIALLHRIEIHAPMILPPSNGEPI